MGSLLSFHLRRAVWPAVGVFSFVILFLGAQDVDRFWILRESDEHEMFIAFYAAIAALFGIFQVGVDQLPKLREFVRHRGRRQGELFAARWWTGFLLGPALLVASTAAIGFLFMFAGRALRDWTGAWWADGAIIEAGDVWYWCVVATCAFSSYAFGAWITSVRGPFVVAMYLRCAAFGALYAWTFLAMRTVPGQWFVPYWVQIALHVVATALLTRDARLHWQERSEVDLPLPRRRALSTIVTATVSIVTILALFVPRMQQGLTGMPYPEIQHLKDGDRFVLAGWKDSQTWECDENHRTVEELRAKADWSFSASRQSTSISIPFEQGESLFNEAMRSGLKYRLGNRRVPIVDMNEYRLFMTLPDATLHLVAGPWPPSDEAPRGTPIRRFSLRDSRIDANTQRVGDDLAHGNLLGNAGATELLRVRPTEAGLEIVPVPLPGGDRYVRWTRPAPVAGKKGVPMVIIGEIGVYRDDGVQLLPVPDLASLRAVPDSDAPNFSVEFRDVQSPFEFTVIVHDSRTERYRHHFAPRTIHERIQAGAIGALAVARPLPLLVAGFLGDEPRAANYKFAWLTDPGVQNGSGKWTLAIAALANSALAFLLIRRLSRLGAERWRIAAWIAALIVAGPVAWPFYRGFEPDLAWRTRRAAEKVTPRIVTATEQTGALA